MTVPSVLAVFAHPDDESLSAGGLLARTAGEGGRTGVITPSRPAGNRASVTRFCDAPLDDAVCGLVEHIRNFRPDIVVTHDAYGGVTGHPDHLHTHRVTVLAAHAAALVGHRSEVRRGALPGLEAGLAADARAGLLGTEWYACRDAT